MHSKEIKLILSNLADLFYIPLAYCGKTSSGYKWETFDPGSS